MYSTSLLLDLYTAMATIRLCEESLVGPILAGEIQCPVHLASGEEAVAAGICSALSASDYVFGTHRSHGHYLAKGGSIMALVAEVYCRETGCSRGRGGSMHLIDQTVGLLGSAPIVAGTISLALGAALASRIRGDERVTVSFFGDGASGEGVLFESLNFAALKNLPLIFACENNLYSTHLSISECRPSSKIADIGKPFGIKTVRVDGNDVLKVRAVASESVALCREGRGPVFLELLTYRLRGHVGPDDCVQGNHTDIRPAEELAKWKRKDPIRRFKRYLLRNSVCTEQDLQKIDHEIQKDINSAHAYARSSGWPKKDEVTKYVYR